MNNEFKKIGIIVGSLSPHVIDLADSLYERLNNAFFVLETRDMTLERQKMGYKKYNRDYLINHFSNEEKDLIIENSNMILFSLGSADISYINNRLKNDKLTCLITERIFKRGLLKLLDYKIYYQLYLNLIIRNKKNIHLFAIGNYTYFDFKKTLFPRNKIRDFGYFINANDKFIQKKDNITKFVWIGRLIDWKRPCDLIKAFSKINKSLINDSWDLEIIGDGPLYDKCIRLINRYYLNKNIKLVGVQSSKYIKSKLLDSNVIVSTSNKREGWGAVINEGMLNSCIVVGTNQGGGASQLINNNKNGFLYDAGNLHQLSDILKTCINKKNDNIYFESYSTINDLWNPKIAADRVIEFEMNASIIDYNNGPLKKSNWKK